MTPAALVLLGIALLVAPGAVSRRPDPRSDSGALPVEHADMADPLAFAGAYDLFAACLRAGMPVSTAAVAAADRAPAELAEMLRRAANLLALGADPALAWLHAGEDGELSALGRLARRSAGSGRALADAVGELADERRAAAEDAAAAAAERAGVLISGPLGLCFLPAFLCLGIVPVVIGLAKHVLGQGLL